MVRKLLASLSTLWICASAFAQQDTLVTKLHEVQVVGVKQNPNMEMAAVTEVNSSSAERLGIVTVKGISEIAPNFYIPDYGSRITSTIYVRGLGARIDQPCVGLNVDGVPFLNKNNYDFDLFDIEKIEIFRGAQSILNGRNTMCGQVNIFTLSPWRYEGWRAMAEYGRANSVKAGLGYYAHLSPTLALSANAYFTTSDGFFRNQFNNGRLDKEKMGSARVKLSWHPSSRLSVTNTASYGISREGGYPYVNLETGQIAYDDTCFYRRNSFADGLVVGWSSKRVVVTSVTSVQHIDDNMTLDQDFMPVPYFTLTQKSKEWALTEDLYAKRHRGNYNWLGGVFGFYKSNHMNAPVTFKDEGIRRLIEDHRNQINPAYPIEWDTRQFVLGSDFLSITKGVALYQQSRYQLGNFDFELGLRWDVEWATLIYDSECNTSYRTMHVLPDGTKEVYKNNPVEIADHGHLSSNFNQLLPKFAVGYAFGSGSRVYANVAKGYKAGGFNTQMFSDVLQQRLMAFMGLTMQYDIDQIVGYKPEKSWNYELGAKLQALGGKMHLDCAIFYISCTDQQLTAFPSGMTTGRIMTNAGRTRSFGVEASLDFLPNSCWELRCSYGYTNAAFRKYNNGIANFRGKRLPYAPSNTAFASATYKLPASVLGARPEVNVNCRGVGKIYWDEANAYQQPFYVTLGASAALESDHWSLRVWGENLTSTKYDTFYFVSIGHAFVQRGLPWTAGATLRVNW